MLSKKKHFLYNRLEDVMGEHPKPRLGELKFALLGKADPNIF